MEIIVSVYHKKGAVSRCTALSVCLELLLLEIGSRVGAEQGMAVKGGARLNHRVSCSFCFEEHTDATGERQRKRLFISFSLSYWRRNLCAQREFSVAATGPVRDVLPRVRHRQDYNYLLARWIWETGKCFVKLNPEFNLGEAQELCCGFHHLFLRSVLHELLSPHTGDLKHLKLSFLVSPLSKIARISHFARQHHFQAKHNKY